MAEGLETGRGWLALATGRIAERFTQTPLTPRRITLALIRAGRTRPLDLRAGCKPGGWFALSIAQLDDLPEPPADEPLRLKLSVDLADGRTRSVETAITGADLARVSRPLAGVGVGRGLPRLTLAGAPFRLECRFDPAPVTLQGVVLANGDPRTPVADAEITSGTLTTRTDPRGGFRLGPLPLTETIALTVEHGGQQTPFTHRLDFSRPLNRTEFSVSS